MSRLMVRQMCGGGTWRREHWKPRRTTKAVIFDAPGIAIAWGNPEHWGPFRFRFHGQWRERALDTALHYRRRVFGPSRGEVWDEAVDATFDWMVNNPSPAGIPHDPPRNPYEPS